MVKTIHPNQLRLGLRPARHDARVPRLSRHAGELPPPPAEANWYSDIEDWQMLGNDQYGDCAWAAIMHVVYQGACYTTPGQAIAPTTEETLIAYAAGTEFDRSKTDANGDNPTDLGTYLIGPGGLFDVWSTRGIIYAGAVNKVTAFMQITRRDPIEWRQAIATFGNLIIGINLPQSIVATDRVPDVWDDPSGPIAGGHAVVLVGYKVTEHRTTYICISWGAIYFVTEDFLLGTLTEAVTVVQPSFLNAAGINAAGVDQLALLADIAVLRQQA